MNDIYEIVVEPEDGASGRAVAEVFRLLNLSVRVPNAVVVDIECNENRAWVQQEAFLTTTDAVIEYARSVGQFDWATFFLFLKPDSQDIAEKDFDALFAAADVTVRAVDSTYVYVYSSFRDDALVLRDAYSAEYAEKIKGSVTHPF